jgi:putative DNA primase/helicase
LLTFISSLDVKAFGRWPRCKPLLVDVLNAIRRNDREEMFLLGQDLDKLEQAIKDHGDVGLVTIDPITAFMGPGKGFDSHRTTDVRSQLGPLKTMAERIGVAFSAITHPPKNAGPRALDHFIGSQAFIAAARLGHLVVPEMEDGPNGSKRVTERRFFTTVKHNIEGPQPTLAYHLETRDVGWDERLQRIIRAPVIVWDGQDDITAEEALAATRTTKMPRASAQDFLRTILVGGPLERTTIVEQGARRGFSYDQLWRAKKTLGVQAGKKGNPALGQPSSWSWSLPEQTPPGSEPASESEPEST